MAVRRKKATTIKVNTAPSSSVSRSWIDWSLLEQLSNAVGVSGTEDEVRQLILKAIEDKLQDIIIDPMGSVLGQRRGTSDQQPNLRVMLTAHMDEAGFMVKKANEDGSLSVLPVGRLDERYVPSSRVLVGKDKMLGVFMWTPIHHSFGRNDVVSVRDMQIDVGASDKGSARAKVGDRIGFSTKYEVLNEPIVRGKAFESRAACTILAALLKGRPFEFDMQVAFTAQEHVFGRGGLIAAHRFQPDLVFVLGGADANDLPLPIDATDRFPRVALGSGPVVSLKDETLVIDRRLFEWVTNLAQREGIAYQIDVRKEIGEAGRIAASALGPRVVRLGIPIRYMDGPQGLMHTGDVEATYRLMRAILNNLNKDDWGA